MGSPGGGTKTRINHKKADEYFIETVKSGSRGFFLCFFWVLMKIYIKDGVTVADGVTQCRVRPAEHELTALRRRP